MHIQSTYAIIVVMIGETLSVINSSPQLTDPAYLRHKVEVGKTVIAAMPESLKNTWESVKASKRRAIGVTALTAANVVMLYGDDVFFYNVFDGVKEGLESSAAPRTAAAMAIAGGLSAVAQGGFARLNQRAQSNNTLPATVPYNEAESNGQGFIDRMRDKAKRTWKAAGKLSLSLTMGVPAHVLREKFSKKEIYAHSAAYGVASALLFEQANINLGAMENPLVPAILVGGLLASRYVSVVCERATADVEDSDITAEVPLMSENEAEFIVAWGK